ncbi:helix-turn-helix domain-containing protein [Kushneria phyllosphaerae]|uniref:HTH-type transcriptional activator Btr n=1 Tax=Kushneria phyllosphaerae TaxID=2100822 RepID=A0A2R8CHC9_9GAMM|nr:helix-turn-helix domain-containing protein [Kushneria phyllosphaerae]SPJ32174.1 HTH-type transcriptional activator Btr [Kushneria phyllosphaerae]
MTIAQTVPVFRLYGETRDWPTPDLLHCETIADRSRPHGWYIRLHRHADLMHLLLLTQGGGHAHLGELACQLTPPALICVPATVSHDFHFSPDTEGHIVTLARPLVEQLQQRLPQAPVLQHADHYVLADRAECIPLTALFEQLNTEYRHTPMGQHEGREAMLNALIEAVVVQLWRRARWQPHHHRAAPHRGEQHLQRYQALIETCFRDQPTVPQMAADVGISSAHLNELCRALAGRSALQLLHDRLLLEARRQLTYTRHSVAAISDQLGFSEPGYFTRFFKRHTGETPRAFRQRLP